MDTFFYGVLHGAARGFEAYSTRLERLRVRGPKRAVFELAPGEHAALKRERRRVRPLAHMARQPLRQGVIRPPAARGVFCFHGSILIAWMRR
jgi:hypothetical protein